MNKNYRDRHRSGPQVARMLKATAGTNLFWRDEEDVDGGPAVHSEVPLGAVRLLEAVQHRRVHLLSVGAGLRVEERMFLIIA